jgi:hypothetical protein
VEDLDVKLVALANSMTVLAQQVQEAKNMLGQQLQETRSLMEKLAAVTGLEYSVDVKDWVAKSKLDELRKHPRITEEV